MCCYQKEIGKKRKTLKYCLTAKQPQTMRTSLVVHQSEEEDTFKEAET
jgi:hypothetical protein